MVPRILVTALAAIALAIAIAASPTASTGGLLALGDSFSSGQGAGSYDRGTTALGNKCYRSRLAWPQLLATRLTLAPQRSLACNGATTADVLRQIKHISGDPKVITVTVGGNDVGFGTVLRQCLTEHDCRKHGGEIDKKVRALAKKLPRVYQSIRA